MHRRTVLQALASAMPPAPKPAMRVAPRLELFKVAADEMLRSDLDAPRKQRTRGLGTPPRLIDAGVFVSQRGLTS